MQANKTDMFVYLFTRFILYTMAINKKGSGLTPDQIVEAIEEIQSGFVVIINTKSSFLSLGFGQISSTTLSFLKL
jgi:hypothetical protein